MNISTQIAICWALVLGILPVCCGCKMTHSDAGQADKENGLRISSKESLVNAAEVGYDSLSFYRSEIETRSWASPSSVSIRYLSTRSVQLQDRRDLVLMFYGSGTKTNCVDFYLQFGERYLLIGHDDAPTEITSVEPETTDGKSFIKITRSIGSNQFVNYSYVYTQSGELRRTLSTFITGHN